MYKRNAKHSTRLLSQRLGWVALITFSIVILAWDNLAKITADLLYLAANRAPTSIDGAMNASTLLGYARLFAPKAPFVYNKEGVIQIELGADNNATTAFQQALRVDQSHGPALNNLAVTVAQQNLMTEAIRLQMRAATAEPNQATVWYNLGMLLARHGQTKEAGRALLEATRIQAEWELPYLALSSIYLDMHDEAAAEKNAKRAITLNPQQKSAHLILIEALALQCKLAEGLQAASQATQLFPSDAALGLRKALLLGELGQPQAALKTLEPFFLATTDTLIRHRILVEMSSLLQKLKQQTPEQGSPSPRCK